MAIGSVTAFNIYDAQFQTGFWEGVQQQIDSFNAASNGTIIMENFDHPGFYIKESLDKLIDAMRIRTVSFVSDVADTPMAQWELLGVKVNWANGPIAMTRDAYLKAGRDPGAFSVTLGQQLGQLVPQHMLNAATNALFGALVVAGSPFLAASYDSSAVSLQTFPTYKGLVKGLAKLGDKMNTVAAWLMDGTTYASLMGDALASYAVNDGSGYVIAHGTTQSLGRPVIITDSPALKVNPSSTLSDRSIIYGLVPGAVRIRISEPPISLVQPVLGKVNIVYRFQAEGTYTVNVRGAAWKTATGHNPAFSDLAANNWTIQTASVKGGPGVAIKTLGTFN